MKKVSPILLFLMVILLSGCVSAHGASPPESNHDLETLATSYGETLLGVESDLHNDPAPPMPPISPPAEAENISLDTFEVEIEAALSKTAEPETPESEKPVIALTFDDGPSGVITPQIVEVLEEYGVKATFCVVGYYLEKNMDIGELIFQSGSELVGHSWDHSYLTKLSDTNIEKQLLDTNALIEEITGDTPLFYRPPYGAVNPKVRGVSENLGMSLLMWSVDPKDWKARDAKIIYERILENVTNGSVIICHDLYESTLEMVKMLIPELLDRGYRFVTVSELFAETDVLPGKLYSSVE